MPRNNPTGTVSDFMKDTTPVQLVVPAKRVDGSGTNKTTSSKRDVYLEEDAVAGSLSTFEQDRKARSANTPILEARNS